MGNIKDELVTSGCPINFGDCYKCEYWKENECQYKEIL